MRQAVRLQKGIQIWKLRGDSGRIDLKPEMEEIVKLLKNKQIYSADALSGPDASDFESHGRRMITNENKDPSRYFDDSDF